MQLTMSQEKKLILVIGATGAQGIAVIDALLAPAEDGTPSPYAVRALTRDPTSGRAKALSAKGVQCVKGAFDNLPTVEEALRGAYGAWINTDGFTVGEVKELFAGVRIFELAKQNGSLRHYVWSNLDYALKDGNYNPIYHCDHYDGKGRVADWMQQQPSDPSNDSMSWSIVTSGPYMEMLENGMFGPLGHRQDGTFVFASPVGKGHVPMIALDDLGFFARYTFDHRVETSGKELKIASQLVGWDELVSTFKKVTGQKAVYLQQTLDEWFDNFTNTDQPVATERPFGDGSPTWKSCFSGWWSLWRDDVVKRDMEWIRRVNPKCKDVETWMREHKYTGRLRKDVLKIQEDGSSAVGPNFARTAKL